ncbi:MAG: hypothetical protein CVV27_16055, partial [Candidatus Melainabacteria bacterium HGW-Melainabacteria-1]
QSSGSLFSAMSKAGDVAKFFGVADDAVKASKVLKTLKWLGPVADGLSGVLDAHGAYKDYQVGDTVGALSKGVSSAAGFTAAGAGVLILAGASGPGAPVVLVGAAVVGLGAWGVDAIWGEDPQESLLRNVGVLKD